MLWLVLIVGVLLFAAIALPRVGKIIIRLFALLIALVILIPLVLIVTFQRMRLKRRRRNAARARAAEAATGSVDHEETPPLGRVIASQ